MLENQEDPLPEQYSKVGIVYNLKHALTDNKIVDAQAEFDSIDTINSIKSALEKGGYNVELIEMDKNFAENIKNADIDIVFNIAEGFGKKGRECEVPAILSMLNIPYTGSDITTLAIALDKYLAKKILSSYNIKTPKSKIIQYKSSLKGLTKLNYPVIVKPNAEGSSKGISEKSVAFNHQSLIDILNSNFENYECDMLVEEFIVGREFTVALLGNGNNVKVFPPMEIVFKKPVTENFNIYSYDVKQNFNNYVTLECPANIDNLVSEKMTNISKKIFKYLSCNDFARIDFMVKDNEIYFIEINPLPGLAPNYSDFPMITESCGVSYNTTVQNILLTAIKRLNNL